MADVSALSVVVASARTTWSYLSLFNDPLYLLILPYCIGQPLFRGLCERTGIYENNKHACKTVMCVYNLILAVFSLWSAVYMVYVMVFELPKGVYGLGHYDSARYEFVSWLFYLSKYVEFLDTYFLILCNRPVIWLQYLHHMGAPLDLGLLHNHGVEGTWIYVVFNGIIHTIMYYYYACCIMKWPFPWKRMITNLQLMQFVSGLLVVLPYAWVGGYWESQPRRAAFMFNFAYVLMNLFMFINFYRTTYLQKKAAAVAAFSKTDAEQRMLDEVSASSDKVSVVAKEENDKKVSSSAADLMVFSKGVGIRANAEWDKKQLGGEKGVVGEVDSDESSTMDESSPTKTSVSSDSEFERSLESQRRAEASFTGSIKILAKSAMLLLLGYLFTSQCCFPSYLVPLGIFISGVALTGVDCAREDCKKGVFFPQTRLNLNKAFSTVLEILLNNWYCIIFAGMALSSVGAMYTESSDGCEFLYRLNYFFLPCVIMRLNVMTMKSDENNLHSREFESAARLVPGMKAQVARLLASAEDGVRQGSISAWGDYLGPNGMRAGLPFSGARFDELAAGLKRLNEVPMYRVNQYVRAVERDVTQFVQQVQGEIERHGEDILDEMQLGVEHAPLPSKITGEELDMDEDEIAKLNNVPSVFQRALRFILSPMRLSFQSIYTWEHRDIALYAIVATYLLMIYVGFYYFSYTPVCILSVLFFPKSASGKFMNRQFRMLEDDAGTKNDTSVKDDKSKLGFFSAFGHQLNVFMCLYIGVCHVLAFHAIVVLCVWSGRDQFLESSDAIIKIFIADFVDNVGGLFARYSSTITYDHLNVIKTAFATPEAVHAVKPATLWFALLLWPISGLGITAGAHRLWSHKSYEAHWLTRLMLMIFNSIANQGSIFHWARDHRTHHLNSDTVSDPHDSNRGWFYAHMGWLLVKKQPEVVEAGRKVDLSDLKRDPIVMFQKHVDPLWNLAFCFGVPAFVAVYAWGETLWNGFLYAGVLRYVYVLHCTWSVNSIVHAFGPSPYDPDELPCESRLVSILALGEGWHSWHHAFAFDYATAELGCLHQWNPTKLFIDILAIFGLVKDRKRGHRMWEQRKKRIQEDAAKKGQHMVEKLHGPPLFKIRSIEFEEDKPDNKITGCPDDGNKLPVPDDDGDEMKKKFGGGNGGGVSAGHLDQIESVPEWEKATGGLTKDKMMNTIPADLKKRCAFTSSLFLARDICYLIVAYKIFYTIQHVPSVAELLESSTAFAAVFWGAYAVAQGTIATGVWVVGHECGHGSFSESSILNDTVGFVTHTLLLVPYFAWQFSHGKHHKYTNHTTMGETHVPPTKPTWLHKSRAKYLGERTPFVDVFGASIDVLLHLLFGWPLYLVLNVTGGRTNWKGERLNKKKPISHFTARASEIFPPQWHTRINISAVGSLSMLGALAVWAETFGFTHMAKWYLGPYLITNAWLVLYTWLHHTHEDVPHFGAESFNWLRGALCTIDRPYPALINHLHHGIGSTHVMHHLNFRIPHYHAAAATECVKPLLGSLYRFDARPILTALLTASERCEFIEGVHGVQWYRKTQGVQQFGT